MEYLSTIIFIGFLLLGLRIGKFSRVVDVLENTFATQLILYFYLEKFALLQHLDADEQERVLVARDDCLRAIGELNEFKSLGNVLLVIFTFWKPTESFLSPMLRAMFQVISETNRGESNV